MHVLQINEKGQNFQLSHRALFSDTDPKKQNTKQHTGNLRAVQRISQKAPEKGKQKRISSGSKDSTEVENAEPTSRKDFSSYRFLVSMHFSSPEKSPMSITTTQF